MTDPGESNHWAELVSELGATPPPEEPEGQPAEAEQPEAELEAVTDDPGASEPPPRAVAPKPRRVPADWSRLAEELGVEVPEEAPPRAIPEPDSASSGRETAAASEEEAEARFEAPAEELAESGVPDWMETDLELGDGVSEPAPAEGEWKEPCGGSAEGAVGGAGLTGSEVLGAEARGEPAEGGAEGSEKKTGRKRRRRRRKPAKAADEEREASETQPDEEPADEIEPMPTASEDDSGMADDSVAERKSLEREAPWGELESEQESADVGEEARSPRAAMDESANREAEDAGKREEDRRADKSEARRKGMKPSHRGIPSWEEAIGIVISANMEGRAKPSEGGGSSRSRGGRNPGGRDRSGESSK